MTCFCREGGEIVIRTTRRTLRARVGTPTAPRTARDASIDITWLSWTVGRRGNRHAGRVPKSASPKARAVGFIVVSATWGVGRRAQISSKHLFSLLISKPLLVRVLDDRAFRDRPLDASTRTHTHTHHPLRHVTSDQLTEPPRQDGRLLRVQPLVLHPVDAVKL